MTARRTALAATLAAALATVLALPPRAAQAQNLDLARPHKVVFQVSDADPAKWNLALNNARNVWADLGRDNVAIEVVAYGPGIGMLKLDSPVATRVAEAMAAGMSVVACGNTMKNQKLAREDMLPNIGYVEAGVVQLMKRQREGFAYVRP
ncbi:MAG: DsrE family protein [Rubrivivax sp.]|nr:DsrE family protein [Rubrivivax sp.]